MRDYYTGFLHAHKFGAKKYDCVWITWVLMYLSDSEIFTLFTRIRAALREDPGARLRKLRKKKQSGLLFVRENVRAEEEEDPLDPDGSVMSKSFALTAALRLLAASQPRSSTDTEFRALFQSVGFEIVSTQEVTVDTILHQKVVQYVIRNPFV